MAEAARRLGLDLAQPASINDPRAHARIVEAAPEVICVCAFGALIKEPLLSAYLMLNVHPSVLPRWRGAAPIERAIMAGDEVTGVTILRITAGLDSGPIYAQQSERIEPRETYGSLARRLEALGGQLLVDVLHDMPAPVAQPETGVTYAEKITPEDRPLDPSRPAVELERRVRALAPHIGAQLLLPEGQALGILEASVVADVGGRPGALEIHDRRPVLICGQGGLRLEAVKPPGRQSMSGEDWVRGHRR